MRGIERRLRALESAAGVSDPEEGEQRLHDTLNAINVAREVLRRMTDRELERYEEAMLAPERREEDLSILQRVEELREQVEHDSEEIQ